MFYYNTCLYLRADICIMLLTVPMLFSIYDCSPSKYMVFFVCVEFEFLSRSELVWALKFSCDHAWCVIVI